MLIKEYRIGLPMTVEEYRIAQLYMIQKKSREESSGSGSGVEIKLNEPYTDGPGGSGQYTYKIYHIGSHLPGWFRSILPKSALRVQEEAWNAYPYTKTIYTCPFIEKFSLEIETKYLNDGGEQENVFSLSSAELRNRIIDYIDIVKDPISSSDYHKEEDPKLYKSQKTGRGPLSDNWWQEYSDAMKKGHSNKCMMVAYKLCRVEFKYWGMQSKIERFIHDTGLRKTMLRAHRQAWVWQDEYHGLTIEDIRRLEHETQLALEEKMAAEAALEEDQIAAGGYRKPVNKSNRKKSLSPKKGPPSPTPVLHKEESDESFKSMISEKTITDEHLISGTDSEAAASCVSTHSTNPIAAASFEHRQSWCSARSMLSDSTVNTSEWQVDTLELLKTSSSDEEFFDAQESLNDFDNSQMELCKSSSMEMIPQESDYTDPSASAEDEEGGALNKRLRHLHSLQQHGTVNEGSQLPGYTAQPCKTTILFLVVHGGSIMDAGMEYKVSKHSDIATFKSTLNTVIGAHYPSLIGHAAVRMIPCPAVCTQTLSLFVSLNPYSFDVQTPTIDNAVVANDNFPLGAIPLFVTGSQEYTNSVCQIVQKLNSVYSEFIQSEEGSGFTGQVCIVADSIGSVLAYDALCKLSPPTLDMPSSTKSDMATTQDTQQDVNKHEKNQALGNGLSYSNPDLTLTDTTETDMHSDSAKSKMLCQGQSLIQRLSSCPISRRTSVESQNEHGKFDFEVSDFFMMESPLSLVLAYRKMCSTEDTYSIPRPCCQQIYNIFYPSDPAAMRLEPLLFDRFKLIPPMKVPRYQKFPLGDGQSVHVVETIQSNAMVFMEPPGSSHSHEAPSLPDFERRQSNLSISSEMSGQNDLTAANITAITSRWWGNKRLDYALYYPEALQTFPSVALPYLLHASCWESTDIIAFILRQVVRQDFVSSFEADSQKGVTLFKPCHPREKWLKRRTTIKVRNAAPNHRANDIIVLEDRPQILTARFMYGPLDMVSLSGERVDIHIMKSPSSGEWEYLDTAVTDSNGRLIYEIPNGKKVLQGIYPIKMVVRGDHTCVDLNLAVLPPKTESIVFSIDGSFTASVSIMGKDPKVRPGAVDVVRYWQELGFLIVYVTARPDMQQKKVVAWLAQHNFPHGMVAFMDGLSADPLKQKANYLNKLVQEADIQIHAGYGSSKDISVYQSVGLQNSHIFIVGKVSKSKPKDINVILDGYAVHLAQLASLPVSRQATGNARMFLRKGCFSLPGQSTTSKTSIRKTMSLPQKRSSFRETTFTSGAGITVTDCGNTAIEPGLSVSGMTQRAMSARKPPAAPYNSSNV